MASRRDRGHTRERTLSSPFRDRVTVDGKGDLVKQSVDVSADHAEDLVWLCVDRGNYESENKSTSKYVPFVTARNLVLRSDS